MLLVTGKAGSTAAVALAFLAALLCALVLVAQPATAYALDTESCTARPNRDGTNDVQGATETRITWEGQAAPDEQISSISLTLPEGTSYSLEDARVTVLGGEDHMDRISVDAEFSSEGQTVTAAFSEPTDPGVYFRVEIYGVFFPGGGGDMQITGSYELADGQTVDIDDVPTIPVIGITLFEQWGNMLSEQDWVQAANENNFIRLFINPVLR